MATYNDRGLKLKRVETGSSITCEDGECAVWTFASSNQTGPNYLFSFAGVNKNLTGDGNLRGCQSGPFFLKGETANSPYTAAACTVTAFIYEDPS